MLSVVSCKRSLNRILKEASDKYDEVPPANKSRARASEAELQALLEETNSLWEEVVPVAHMAVEKTMLEPILKLVNTKMEAQDYQNAIIGSYVCRPTPAVFSASRLTLHRSATACPI